MNTYKNNSVDVPPGECDTYTGIMVCKMYIEFQTPYKKNSINFSNFIYIVPFVHAIASKNIKNQIANSRTKTRA